MTKQLDSGCNCDLGYYVRVSLVMTFDQFDTRDTINMAKPFHQTEVCSDFRENVLPWSQIGQLIPFPFGKVSNREP